MKKINFSIMNKFQGGITPHWTDCAFLTGAAIVTTLLATPAGGSILGGIAAGCWYHVR
ncbi:hypothetical protein WBJ53_22665 [Spirosoma sp. SC4-14]|uniref:hypothetical protein n=1 Tax=Spirosoma sp. SC4-14 TaxID=3128900 RepID=UPI0030D37AA8